MRFSELCGITRGPEDDWYDPVLSEDTPLYVDPLLVFGDDDPLFADARQNVVGFFALCRDLIRQDNGQHGRAWNKALRLLTFPEPVEFALGLAMGSPFGSGTDEHFAVQMAEALDVISHVLERPVDYVESFALFVPGLGVDRISDIFCNILKAHFVRYTEQVCAAHNIAGEPVAVRHSAWNASGARWTDLRRHLPVSPVTDQAVLLVPERFLQDIPLRITTEGFYNWAEANQGHVLREDLNFDLAEDISRTERSSRGHRLAMRRPDIAFTYVDDIAEHADPAPYDVDGDPDLLVGWHETGRAASAAITAHSSPLVQPQQDDFHAWLGTLIDRFQHAVEDTDLWRTFWNDALTRHRQEKIVQAVAGVLWAVQCEHANVDISREANMGRGPVDFKFSAGWKQRALIEVKLLSSRKLQQGALAQLPQYLTSERITSAYYVCVGFTDAHLDETRLAAVRATCRSYQEQSGRTVTPRFIDARPKQSASKL
jgi:hypothetical protein